MMRDWVYRIVIAVGIVAIVLCLVGMCGSLYEANSPRYSMQVVTTGDVKWACLERNGEIVGCDTVEEYK